jgi:cytochrome b involved in lipid metabolism
MKGELLLQIMMIGAVVFLIVFYSLQYSQQVDSIQSLPRPTTSSQLVDGNKVTLSASEVQKHKTSGDCWLIIENNVYDVSLYLSLHPGGADRIIPYCGQDATTAFLTQGGRGRHSAQATQQLSLLLLGPLNSTINQNTIDQTKNNINNSVNNSNLKGEKDDD